VIETAIYGCLVIATHSVTTKNMKQIIGKVIVLLGCFKVPIPFSRLHVQCLTGSVVLFFR